MILRQPVLCFLFLVATPTIGMATSDSQELLAEIGFDGIVRAGHWTPVTLHIPQSLAQPSTRYVAVEAQDPDGQWLRSPLVRPTSINDTQWAARLLVKIGGRDSTIRAVVIDTTEPNADRSHLAQVVASRIVPIPQLLESSQEVLMLFGDLENATRATRLAAREDGSRMLVVSPEPRSDSILLSSVFGPPGLTFDGVNKVIICGNSITRGISNDHLLELDAWIREGGDLILIAGMSLPDAISTSPSLESWLPGKFSRLVPLRRASALETYARSSRPLARRAIEKLQIPIFEDLPKLQGVIEASVGGTENDPPLVVRRAYGFGRITWIGIDLDTRTFASWPGTDSLVLKLLDIQNSGDSKGRAGETRRGGLDLAGQLRLAVDKYLSVFVIPFELIALIGLLYVAALYPLDWWIARRSERFGWITWLTLPLIVLAFTGITWSTTQQFKSDGWQIHTAGVFDIDEATQTCRSTSFAGIWASNNGRFSLSANPAPDTTSEDSLSVVSWFAASGRNIGGPDALTPHPSLAEAPYEYGSSAARLQNISIAAASSQLFEANSTSRLPTVSIQSTISRTGQGTLRGTITNKLQVALNDCVLMHAGWLYDIGTLRPGDTFNLEAGKGPRSLGAFLTKKRAVKDRNVSARWKSDDRDISRILEVAGMHRATGGSEYTGLQSGRLEHIDMTHLLALDRVILMGKGPSATKWLLQKTSEPELKHFKDAGNTTLWRIVLELRN
ncbi:MAG: hypothetical protein P8J43_00010 [Pirellulales bacterium]|nr:hypothetical protein [Pirellulales bacterium]